MKFGVREICDVVLRAKTAQKIGSKIFYKNEPVCYFDTLKTSSMEGAATTVYAQGGRGNSRLVAWEGERTVTFTMEDALISPAGFMILSGAGLTDASTDDVIYVHTTETTSDVTVTKTGDNVSGVSIILDSFAHTSDSEDLIYIMLLDNGEVTTEPYIPASIKGIYINDSGLEVKETPTTANMSRYIKTEVSLKSSDDLSVFTDGCAVLADYYVAKTSGAQQIDITPDKFGGNYYLEASTLFRNQDGVDMPAEFIIPNCKIQSNFTFTMASSGDPSTFTFTIDAFPDYTRFDKTKKVLAAIQIIETAGTADISREHTAASTGDNWSDQKTYFED